jgi:hypothetical protein
VARSALARPQTQSSLIDLIFLAADHADNATLIGRHFEYQPKKILSRSWKSSAVPGQRMTVGFSSRASIDNPLISFEVDYSCCSLSQP